MNLKLSARVLIVLSMCYGIVIAILGFLDSSAVTTVAVIGALVLGVLWAVRGVLASRGSST
jgi:predicted membrane-bound mannosyltransferase